MRYSFGMVIAAFTLAFGGGCVVDSRQRATGSSTEAPDALRYENTFALGGVVKTYEVKGDFIIKRFSNTQNPYSDQRSVVMRRKPAAPDWAAFWQEVGPLRLWEWKKSYEPPSNVIISDGTCWTFSCRRGSLRVQSTGCNVAPKLGQPQAVEVFGESIGRLERALERLVNPRAAKSRT